jgi:DNA-binding transcriptional ArsR family regulator
VGKLPLEQATVSQHLKAIKEVELIEGIVDGYRVCYCINIK